jgi:hypothetical protein
MKIEPLLKETTAKVGSSFNLRFKATVSGTREASQTLEDVGVLVFLAPGIWQYRDVAKPLGDGVYELNFVPPQPGIYYVYFQCPSLDIHYNQIRPLTIQAVRDGTATNN